MDSVAFSIFGMDIAWYGIIIASAMVIGSLILLRVGKEFGYKEDDLLDLLIIMIPSGIVGARIYYVIFNLTYYSQDPITMFQIRNGGLAIHGGIIGGFIGAYIVCKFKKLNFWDLIDMIVIPTVLGQAIGRWGNYINGEAHGGPTDLPWGIMVDGVKVHPTFLYESICNICVCIVLVYIFKKRKFYGEVFSWYLILYSLGRVWIEGLRTDSLMFGPIRVAQLISLAFILMGAILLLYKKNKIKNGELKIIENLKNRK